MPRKKAEPKFVITVYDCLQIIGTVCNDEVPRNHASALDWKIFRSEAEAEHFIETHRYKQDALRYTIIKMS